MVFSSISKTRGIGSMILPTIGLGVSVSLEGRLMKKSELVSKDEARDEEA